MTEKNGNGLNKNERKVIERMEEFISQYSGKSEIKMEENMKKK